MFNNYKQIWVGKGLHAKVRQAKISFAVYLKLWLINAKISFENLVLKFFRFILYKQLKNHKKILIFRTGSLGDSINALPSIQAVIENYPSAYVDILTNAGKKNLVGLQYLIKEGLYNEIIDYNGLPKRKLFHFLKQKKYDLIIQLPQVDAGFVKLLRDLIFFRWIAPEGSGWFVSQSKWFKKTQSKYLTFENENERLLRHMMEMGYIIKHPFPRLNIQNSDIEFVKNLMLNNNIKKDRIKICVVIGAKRSQNRWPINYFKEVITHFLPRAEIILIGSTEDQILSAPLNIAGVTDFCGKLTPIQSAALISFCDVTLSNDTGPMHMSYAVQTPTIALFSSRDLPGKWYPPENNNVVFRAKDIKCEACFSEVCKNNICMQAIKPEKVINAMEQLIEMKVSDCKI